MSNAEKAPYIIRRQYLAPRANSRRFGWKYENTGFETLEAARASDKEGYIMELRGKRYMSL